MLIKKLIEELNLNAPINAKTEKYYKDKGWHKIRIFANNDEYDGIGITFEETLTTEEYFKDTQLYSTNVELIQLYLQERGIIPYNENITHDVFATFILFHEEGHFDAYNKKLEICEYESYEETVLNDRKKKIAEQSENNRLKFINQLIGEIIKYNNENENHNIIEADILQDCTIQEFGTFVHILSSYQDEKALKEAITKLEVKYKRCIEKKYNLPYSYIKDSLNNAIENLNVEQKELTEKLDKTHRQLPEEIYADEYAAYKLKEYLAKNNPNK